MTLSDEPEPSRLRRMEPRLAIGQPGRARDAEAAIRPRPDPAASAQVRFRVCVITDGQGDGDRLLAILGAALRAAPAGAVAVQLRERMLPGAALYALGGRLRELTTAAGAALFINDRLDVALAVGADGVHLPSHGLPVQSARRALAALGSRLLVSAACHSLPEAQMAVVAGADLVTIGPIWSTPSKPEGPLLPGQQRVSPLGTATLAQVTAALPVPVFALGGIDTADRAAACVAAGARVACIRLILNASEPATALRELLTHVST